MLPAYGVYAAWAVLEDSRRFPAAVNVGLRPTFGVASDPVAEAHLIGFSGDLDGKPLRLAMMERLREERKFKDAAELTAQIRNDVDAVSRMLPG